MAGAGISQEKYFTRDGHIKFFSSTPVEDIEADNHKVTSVLDEATGKLEFAANMKSFEFEKVYMKEDTTEDKPVLVVTNSNVFVLSKSGF